MTLAANIWMMSSSLDDTPRCSSAERLRRPEQQEQKYSNQGSQRAKRRRIIDHFYSDRCLLHGEWFLKPSDGLCCRCPSACLVFVHEASRDRPPQLCKRYKPDKTCSTLRITAGQSRGIFDPPLTPVTIISALKHTAGVNGYICHRYNSLMFACSGL